MTATEGTLQEFDIVLSINEASINQQFRLLYLTPIRKGGKFPLPPAPGQPAPPQTKTEPEYLISHKIALQADGGQSLSGYIECPRVDFTPIENKPHTIRLVFKFLTNEEGFKGDPENGIPAFDEKYHSKLVSDVAEPKSNPPTTRKEMNLNGYTFSFEAALGKANIKELQEEFLHPDTYKSLEGAVRDDALLPSSIFCLLQAKEIVETVTVQDPSGNPVQKNSTFDDLIAKFFAVESHQDLPDSNVAKPGNGLPTPNNPFVLGYGISQHSSSKSPSSTFMPKNFQFSVTNTGPKDFRTLNFLMLTHDMEDVSNITKNPNAGNFQCTFFDVMGANYMHPMSKLPEYEGILGLSAGTFIRKVVNEIADKAWISMPQEWDAREQKVRLSSQGRSPLVFGTWSRCSEEWKSSPDWIEWQVILPFRERWAGRNEIAINFESFPRSLNSGNIPMDEKRTVVVWVNNSIHVDYVREMRSINPFSEHPYSTVVDAKFDLSFQRCFVISTGADGALLINEDLAQRRAPAVTKDAEGHNHFEGIEKHVEYFGGFTLPNLFEAIERLILELLIKIREPDGSFDTPFHNWQIEDNGQSFSDLRNKFVLPAGGTVNVNGIGVDGDGHVYNLMKYKTVMGGERLEG